ncbi:MAG: hypothetical protein Q8P20_04550 [bacterium]|nr:hypothetical protein [bacterium]
MTFFQSFDDKQNCVGFCDESGMLYFDEIPNDLSHTWNYSQWLKHKENIEYAFLYCRQPIDGVCPEYLKNDWDNIKEKLKAYYRSFVEAKVNLHNVCFFDLIPVEILTQYCKVKMDITKYVFETYSKPNNYDLLLDITKLITDIKYRNLNFDKSFMIQNFDIAGISALHNKVKNGVSKVEYNLFGSVTGRLTTKNGSFPILNLRRELRRVLLPNNDFFVEFDYNACDLRVMLAMLGEKQPQNDIHEWNRDNIFKQSDMTREQIKKETFSWLYNMDAKSKLETLYNRQKMIDMYWNKNEINTVFDRKIQCDRNHALSYLNQSVTSDLVNVMASRLNNILENKKSYVSFMIFDSVVLDFHKDDKEMLMNLLEEFKDTPLGRFVVNMKIGKNYGQMRKVKV